MGASAGLQYPVVAAGCDQDDHCGRFGAHGRLHVVIRRSTAWPAITESRGVGNRVLLRAALTQAQSGRVSAVLSLTYVRTPPKAASAVTLAQEAAATIKQLQQMTVG